MASILVVEDNKDIRESLVDAIRTLKGGNVYAAESDTAARRLLDRITEPLVVLLDIYLPDDKLGLYFLQSAKVQERIDSRRCVVIAISAISDAAEQQELLNAGAFDFIPKSADGKNPALLGTIFRHLERASQRLVEANQEFTLPPNVIGRSAKLVEAYKSAFLQAVSGKNLLIYGETGTGKEELAKAIHRWRCDGDPGPFVVAHGSDFPGDGNLARTELFGIEAGVLQAVPARDGKAEQARGGTLFIDDLQALPLQNSNMFLRLLQEREGWTVGGRKIAFDSGELTVVAAINRPARELIEISAEWRQFFERFRMPAFTMPNLAERQEDIPALVQHFIKSICDEEQSNPRIAFPRSLDIDDEALGIIHGVAHRLTGNVRQLQNIINCACWLCARSDENRTRITVDDIKIALLEQDIELEEASLPAKKESWRKEVEKMVERCGGNKKLAAQLLGVHVSTVYRALEDAN